MDTFLFHAIGMTHPDIWMMWAAIILSALNTWAILMMKPWRKK